MSNPFSNAKPGVPLLLINSSDLPNGDCLSRIVSLSGLCEHSAICICGPTPALLQEDLPAGWKLIELKAEQHLMPGSIYVAPKDSFLHATDGFPYVTKNALHPEKAELKRLKTMLLNSDEGMAIISPEGAPLYITPGVAHILRYSLEELIGMQLFEIVHPDDHGHIGKVLGQALEQPGVKIAGGAVRMLRKDGQWRWCDANLTNMLHDPVINGILDNFRDITELVEAQHLSDFNQHNTKALINGSNNAIWSIDKAHRLISFNNAFHDSILAMSGKKVTPGMDMHELTAVENNTDVDWNENYEKVLKGAIIGIDHHQINPTNGKKLWLQTRLQPIEDQGNIYGVAAYTNDVTSVTEHIRNIEELNEKLLLAQQISELGYWKLIGKHPDRVEWSEEIYTIMEWEKLDETIAFEDFRASVHPDDLDYLDKKTVEIFGGVASFDLSHRVITKSGVVKWVRQLGRVNSKNGEVISMEGVLQDISAFKATELELTNRNNFIEKAIDNLPLGIAVNDMDTGEVTLINKKFSEIYGWPIEMLTDIYQFFDCVYPDKTHRDKMKSLIFSDIESDDPNRMHWKEIASTTQTGEVRIVDAQNIALPNQRLMISTVMDVTERIKNQKALLLSNQRYEYASKASFDAMWDYDVDSKMVYWGSGMEEHFGYKLLNGSSDLNFWIELIHKEEREAVVKQINRALIKKKNKTWSAEYRMKRAGGEYAFVIDRGYILRNDEGKAYRMIGAIQDITESKMEELKLRLRESVISNTKEAVMISEIVPNSKDKDTTVFVNDSFIRMTGLGAEDVIGRDSKFLFDAQEDPVEKEQFKRAKATFSPFEFEMMMSRKDEGTFWMSFSMSPVPDDNGNFTHWVYIMRDITERREYVELLTKQNKKLKDIAFTQSHVVRAPLARLMGVVNLLAATDKSDEDFEAMLENVQLSAHELDHIIKRIVGKTKERKD